MRFLIVHESEAMRRIIMRILSKLEGEHHFVQAATGQAALGKFAATGADMIITGLSVPEMETIEFVRAVRATANGKDVHILSVQTNVATGDLEKGLIPGVQDKTGLVLKRQEGE